MGNLLKLLLLLACVPTFAEDIYITDQTSGGDTGADCANAHSASWLNTSGNWGAGAGKISAGDTVHLCGTITNKIILLGSGTPGSEVTIKFETGSKLSAPTWGASGSAFGGTNLHDIIVDGGVNGLIECTANGTGLTYSNACAGLDIEGCNNVEVKNLTTTNIYVRVPHSSDSLSGMVGILLNGSTNLTIHNCNTYWSHTGVYIQYASANGTNCSLYSNTLANVGSGIIVGAAGVNCILNGVTIHHNDVSGQAAWDSSAGNTIHCEAIHMYAKDAGEHITNCVVYANYMHGDCGLNSTAQIYMECVDAPLIYNNLIVLTGTNHPFDGIIAPESGTGARVFNNTVIGNLSGCGGFAAALVARTFAPSNAIVVNNLFYDCRVPLFYQTNTVSISDTNVLCTHASDAVCNALGLAGSGFNLQFYLFCNSCGSFNTFGNWNSTYGYDLHSFTNIPALDSSYVPTPGDTIARGAGINLSSIFNTDFYGNPRPASSAWTIGALENPSGIIGVVPSSLNFGTLLTNTSASLTFYVTNSGVSTLTGTATTSSPFSILSGGSYTLGANAAQTVTVQYSPTIAANDSGTVTCTGGGGATVSLSGSATNAPFFGVMTKISGNVTISGATLIK